MAFAALGAAEVLRVDPDDLSARRPSVRRCGRHDQDPATAGWPWPEHRLTYANATLPEAMIAAGSALDRPALMEHGLELLEWLLDRESQRGHLSVTPVGGSGPDDEVRDSTNSPLRSPLSLMRVPAPAPSTATDDGRTGSTAAANWFLGDNDSGVLMWDPEDGGGL